MEKIITTIATLGLSGYPLILICGIIPIVTMFISICYYRNNKTIFCILQITCFILSIPNFVISKILALVIVIGETEGAYVDRDPQTGYMKLAEKKRLGWFAVIYCIIAGITLFGMICYKFDS